VVVVGGVNDIVDDKESYTAMPRDVMERRRGTDVYFVLDRRESCFLLLLMRGLSEGCRA
jgi:hypothetical protein